MSILKIRLPFFLIWTAAFLNCPSLQSQKLHLKVTGDSARGFHVNIYDGNLILVSNTEEFSLRISNTDLSTTANFTWKGKKWTGNNTHIILTKDSYIPEFDANLSVSVGYEVVDQHTIKKTIRILQSSMPDMYYILDEVSRPAQKPLKYVTFEYDNFPGGLIHEMYPSAGFVTPNNSVVGFLTDAGYKNQYTRTTRRRFSGRGGGFVGMRLLPDPALFAVATPAEQALDSDFIKQTFGEMYNLDAGTTTIIKPGKSWHNIGNVHVESNDSLISLVYNTDRATPHRNVDPLAKAGIPGNAAPSGPAGVEFIAPLRDQKIYTLSFLCKGTTPVSVKLFRIRHGKKTIELEDGIKYIDNFPTNNKEWTLFKGSILIPYIEHDSVSLFIGTQYANAPSANGLSDANASGQQATLQIKDLHWEEHQPRHEPYNILPLGKTTEKTTYIFVEPWTNHHDFMISSQSRLAEGKGFKGSQIEKMLYANFNMLTWITTVNDFTPFNVPNMNYAPDMYNRDAFFSTVSSYNKELNLAIWNQWGNTQTPQGGIGTIITPYMGSVEAKDNEATIEWLIWALLNKRRFQVDLPQGRIKKAVDYILNQFDSAGDGICRSHFPMSQVDIIDYNPKTDRLAVNQGMLAIALRTIKSLGFDISEAHIQKAENAYRAFYDPQRKHLLFDRKFPDIISLTDLEPEFFSLWLFQRPILTDSMVINQLEHFPILNKVSNSPHPEYGTTAPICLRVTNDTKGYAYLSRDYQPFEKFGEDNYSDGKNDGFYYNGGSWMRAEYCAYVTGLKHGWTKARPLMDNRVWAEINLNPQWPFSKEFIPTKWTTTDSWWPSTKGLCWNVFILMADEVAGLRTPDMDPDYKASIPNP
jgi:hypothetical protein